MERYELPDGWEWSTLGKCVDVLDSQRVPVNEKERTKRISGKDKSSLYPYYGATQQVGWIDEYLFDEELLLLGEDGAPFLDLNRGKAYMINGKSWVNNHAHVLRAKKDVAVNAFLLHYLNTFDYSEYVSGTTRLKLNQAKMREIPVSLPPIPEQQCIVSKIEKLFEQSQSARTALTRVPALMSQFRRAVLASAFRGELVEPDPNDEPAASLLERIRDAREQSGYKKNVEPVDTSDLPELPEGWEWATIEQIGNVSGGLTKNSKRSTLTEKLPYLRVANVYFNRLDLSDVQEIGIQESELARTLLEKGDLLVVEGNGSIEQIGRVAVWDGSIEPCVHQNHIIKVRFSPTGISEYILFWLLSTEGRDQIMKVTSSTSGLYTLSLSKVSELLVPLAPLALQSRIVSKIEALFTQADIIEQAASVSLRRAEQVDQSILARAFRGELG